MIGTWRVSGEYIKILKQFWRGEELVSIEKFN